MKQKSSMRVISVCILSLLFAAPVYSQTTKQYDRFMVGLDVGPAIMSGKSNLSPFGVHYRGEHKNATMASAKFSYFFDKNLFVGVKYTGLESSANYKADNGSVAEDIIMSYVAPQIGVKSSFSRKFIMGISVGAGYLHYNNKGIMESTEYKVKASTWGINGDLNFDYMLMRNLSLGLGISYMTGSFDRMHTKVEEEPKEKISFEKWNKIKFNPVGITLGIKATF